MPLQLKNSELIELLEDFYILTGIRTVIFDEYYNKTLSYLTGANTICSEMRTNPDFYAKCCECDQKAFKHCKETKSLYIYTCHAGLIEAVMPIIDDERIIGYIMFGRITDTKNTEELFYSLAEQCARYEIDGNVGKKITEINYLSRRQIRAAAKMLETCAEYIKLKKMIQPMGQQLIYSIEDFVNKHISEDFGVDRLCEEFSVSRTRLYDMVRPYSNVGIAEWIRNKRLAHAKKLIETTDMSIPDIASASGFSDYNYFLRIFKKKYGASSRTFRNKI